MNKKQLEKKLAASAIVGVDRYFTKPALAYRIVEWAILGSSSIYPSKILEPNAGGGAFVDAALKVADSMGWGTNMIHITAVEIDTVYAARLERKYANEPRVKVICGDFLQFKVRPGSQKMFHLALMNPPYGARKRGDGGADAKHVRHALRFSERAVGLLVSGFEHGKGRGEELFDEAYVTKRIVLERRPGFEGPEDKGEQARRDHVVLELKEKKDAAGYNGSLVNNVPTERWRLDKEGNPVSEEKE